MFSKYNDVKLKEKAEIDLAHSCGAIVEEIKGKTKIGDFDGVLRILVSLRAPVDKFFDEVLVMAPQKDLMQNRLALLKNIIEIFSPIGDISKLEVK